MAWVKAHQTEAEKARASQAGGGLKIAGSDPNRKEEDGIGVVISTDKDEATRKMERDAEAEMKRQQNALPAWHLKSTISGDLTALGVKESARAEAANTPVISDDPLRGLGRARHEPEPTLNIVQEEDVKPAINQELDCKTLDYLSSLITYGVQIMTSIMPLWQPLRWPHPLVTARLVVLSLKIRTKRKTANLLCNI